MFVARNSLITVRRINVIFNHLRAASTSSSLCQVNYHSKPQLLIQRNMKVQLLPAWQDNYMYLVIDEATKEAAVVDPVEPQKVLSAVKREGATLTTVLTTHHHGDHAGGNEEIAKLVSGLTVCGGDNRIPAVTNIVKQDDEVSVGKLKFKCLFTPCHTSGHICYYIAGTDEEAPAVFTGDTLFVAGCGRFFEGNPQLMHNALIEKLAKLPPTTKVYCGHEYTVNNLKFAIHVEQDNKDIKEKLDWATARRQKNEPTIPSTIGDELKTNPFMRTSEQSVKDWAKQSDPVAVMGSLRDSKDKFVIGSR